MLSYIIYDLTYLWNLKRKKIKLIDADNRWGGQ